MDNVITKRVRFPIVSKISLTILLFMTVSILVAAFWMMKSLNTTLLGDKKQVLQVTLQEKTREIKTLLETGQRIAAQVAESSSVVSFLADEGRTEQNKKIMAEFDNFPINPEIVNIYLLDTNGRTVLSRDVRFSEQSYAFRNYFKQSMVGKPFVESAIGVTTDEFGIYYGTPVRLEQKIIGVAVVKMVPQRIKTALENSYLSSVGYFFLVDKNGVVVYSNKPETLYKSLGALSDQQKSKIAEEKIYANEIVTNLQYDSLQQKVLNETSFLMESINDTHDKKQELLGLAKVDGYPFFLVEEQDLGKITEGINKIVSSLVATLSLSVVVSGLVVILLVIWLLRPLRRISKYANEVAGGDLSQNITIKTGDEMESLGENINQIMSSLKELSLGLEIKVAEKTTELEKSLKLVGSSNKDLEDTKRAIMNVMEDLSEEKEQMAIEKSRLETILTSIGDGVFVVDKEGRVIMANKAALTMSGFSLNESLQKYYSEVFQFRLEENTEEKYADFVKKVLDSGVPQSLDSHTVIKNKDGSLIPVLDSVAPIRDSNGDVYGCVVVFRDNTKERELEKTKDDFLSVTSHQLRTPLGAMRWNLEMLIAGDVGEISAGAKALAEQIHESDLRMIDLVNDLLNVNRIDQGRVLDNPMKTDLNEIITIVIKEIEPEAKRRAVNINHKLQKLPDVIIDPKRFKEAIINLMTNSVKYNKPKGKVDVKTYSKDEKIFIEIADNGVGVPKKDQPNIFQKFFRASNAVRSETEGSGLGLYVVKKFVDGWGGKITLTSKEGVGTKLIIALPLTLKKLNPDGKNTANISS